MDYPYASWCREHAGLPPKQFLKEFNKEYQPTTENLASLACWVFKNMPSNQNLLEIQDTIWSRIEGLKLKTWRNLKLEETESYTAFLERREKNETKRIQEIEETARSGSVTAISQLEPEAYKDVAPLDINELWKTYFPTQTIEEVCQLILGEVPLENLSIDDTLLILIHALITKLQEDHPINQKAHDLTMKMISGTQLSHQQLCVDDSGQTMDAGTVMEAGRKIALDYSSKLILLIPTMLFKGKKDEVNKFEGALKGLCSLLHQTFSNVNHARRLSLPISTLFSEKTKKKSGFFSQSLCVQYIQAPINCLTVLEKFFGRSAEKKVLEDLEKELTSLSLLIRNYDKKEYLPSHLMKWHQRYLTSCRTFMVKMESIFKGDSSYKPKDWLFVKSPAYDLAAIMSLIYLPLISLEKNLENGLTHHLKLDKGRRLELLPDPARLVANLIFLYESRTIIAGYLDILRINMNPLRNEYILSIEKKGRSLHETISDFSLNIARLELNKLITLLKPTLNTENATAGELLVGINHLKFALANYLDELIGKSIGDADEVLESLEKVSCLKDNFIDIFSNLPKDSSPSDKNFIAEQIKRCSKKTREFLEAVAWLQMYFKKQRPIWNEELCKAPVIKAKKKNKTKGSKQQLVKKTKQTPPPKVEQPLDVVLPTPPAEVIKTSTAVVPTEKPPKPTESELWKAEVARIRSMRIAAHKLKCIEEARLREQPADREDLRSVEMLLEGSLHRRSAQEIAFLAAKKVRVIIEELEKEGWKEDRVTGDHHIFKHPCLMGNVVIPYTSKSDKLDRGTFQSIAKTAGWTDD